MISLLSLLGCARYKTFHEGRYNGQRFVLEEKEIKGFSTNSFRHRVQLGNLPAADITVHTTDWGPPYSLSPFAGAPLQPLETPLSPYQPEPEFVDGSHPHTLLYFPPERFSRAQFDQYAAFMQQEWPAINQTHGSKPYGSFPYIIGLVYGNRDDFARSFEHQVQGETFVLRIEPDGRISYYQKSKQGSDLYSGLVPRVQANTTLFMRPEPSEELSRASLAGLKDAGGKRLSDYFTLLEQPAPNAADTIP